MLLFIATYMPDQLHHYSDTQKQAAQVEFSQVRNELVGFLCGCKRYTTFNHCFYLILIWQVWQTLHCINSILLIWKLNFTEVK